MLKTGDPQDVQDFLREEKLPAVEPIMDVFHGIDDAFRVIHVLVNLQTYDAVDARLTAEKENRVT